MTPSKWFASGLLGLALLGSLGFFFFRGERLKPPAAAPAARALPPEVQKFKSAPPVQRVQEFYATESQRIGAVDPNPQLTQQRLEMVAAELRPEEIRWLLGEAADVSRGGDGRFFATYLLALSPVPEAVAALGFLASSPVPKSKNQAQTELERQVRAQAVEGLGRACAGNSEAKDKLLDVVEKQEDEFLRDRSHRALYQCESGKAVEAQDKEALEKVLYGK